MTSRTNLKTKKEKKKKKKKGKQKTNKTKTEEHEETLGDGGYACSLDVIVEAWI